MDRVSFVRESQKGAVGKALALVYPDLSGEQESHISRSCWMRRHITLKSDTCVENTDVDVAGISVKEFAYYPGRSSVLPCAIVFER